MNGINLKKSTEFAIILTATVTVHILAFCQSPPPRQLLSCLRRRHVSYLPENAPVLPLLLRTDVLMPLLKVVRTVMNGINLKKSTEFAIILTATVTVHILAFCQSPPPRQLLSCLRRRHVSYLPENAPVLPLLLRTDVLMPLLKVVRTVMNGINLKKSTEFAIILTATVTVHILAFCQSPPPRQLLSCLRRRHVSYLPENAPVLPLLLRTDVLMPLLKVVRTVMNGINLKKSTEFAIILTATVTVHILAFCQSPPPRQLLSCLRRRHVSYLPENAPVLPLLLRTDVLMPLLKVVRTVMNGINLKKSTEFAIILTATVTVHILAFCQSPPPRQLLSCLRRRHVSYLPENAPVLPLLLRTDVLMPLLKVVRTVMNGINLKKSTEFAIILTATVTVHILAFCQSPPPRQLLSCLRRRHVSYLPENAPVLPLLLRTDVLMPLLKVVRTVMNGINLKKSTEFAIILTATVTVHILAFCQSPPPRQLLSCLHCRHPSPHVRIATLSWRCTHRTKRYGIIL